MVALRRLLEAVLVRAQLVLVGPRGAVDALQLRVLLGAAPVGGGDAHQGLAVADHAGVRQVRAAAEVLPDRLAGLRVDVVVDGELARADLDRLVVVAAPSPWPAAPFRPMSSSLYGSPASSARASSSVTTRRTKRWPERMIRVHLLVDRLRASSGVNGLGDVEVVVEAVGDRRTDAELGLGVDRLHRLREHVRGRSAAGCRVRRASRRHRLDDVRRR